MDGINNYATMHIVTDTKKLDELKKEIKDELKEHGISHTTIETEGLDTKCCEHECSIIESNHHGHHHHHH